VLAATLAGLMLQGKPSDDWPWFALYLQNYRAAFFGTATPIFQRTQPHLDVGDRGTILLALAVRGLPFALARARAIVGCLDRFGMGMAIGHVPSVPRSAGLDDRSVVRRDGFSGMGRTRHHHKAVSRALRIFDAIARRGLGSAIRLDDDLASRMDQPHRARPFRAVLSLRPFARLVIAQDFRNSRNARAGISRPYQLWAISLPPARHLSGGQMAANGMPLITYSIVKISLTIAAASFELIERPLLSRKDLLFDSLFGKYRRARETEDGIG
jgi:hypothetical protein